MMRKLSVEDSMVLHKKVVDRTGGSQGIRDIGLVESAINRAFATFDGEDLYKTTEAQIAVITYILVNNHGFVDGNKRLLILGI